MDQQLQAISPNVTSSKHLSWSASGSTDSSSSSAASTEGSSSGNSIITNRGPLSANSFIHYSPSPAMRPSGCGSGGNDILTPPCFTISDSNSLFQHQLHRGGPSEPLAKSTTGVAPFAGPDSGQMNCARLIRRLASEIVIAVDRHSTVGNGVAGASTPQHATMTNPGKYRYTRGAQFPQEDWLTDWLWVINQAVYTQTSFIICHTLSVAPFGFFGEEGRVEVVRAQFLAHSGHYHDDAQLVFRLCSMFTLSIIRCTRTVPMCVCVCMCRWNLSLVISLFSPSMLYIYVCIIRTLVLSDCVCVYNSRFSTCVHCHLVVLSSFRGHLHCVHTHTHKDQPLTQLSPMHIVFRSCFCVCLETFYALLY